MLPSIKTFAPHMSADEVACYQRHLSQAHSVLEYGMGGSTVLAAEGGVGSLYSVESDPAWLADVSHHAAVQRMVEAGHAKLVHIDIGPTGKWGKPQSSRQLLRWPAYAQHPWRDGFNPHLVLVDGRFRVSCIMAAIQHGVPKIVVHDFWTRRRLHTVLEFATVVDRVDALAVLKPKEGSPAWRATLVEWRHRYDLR